VLTIERALTKRLREVEDRLGVRGSEEPAELGLLESELELFDEGSGI
jgi:hypothetical protein